MTLVGSDSRDWLYSPPQKYGRLSQRGRLNFVSRQELPFALALSLFRLDRCGPGYLAVVQCQADHSCEALTIVQIGCSENQRYETMDMRDWIAPR